MTATIGATGVVLGIGMSSKATAEEVRALVSAALRGHQLQLGDVAVVATRQQFAFDKRLAFGRPVTGVSDQRLVAESGPCERTVGLCARVAETAALLAATQLGSQGTTATLLGSVQRSAHATVAIAAPDTGAEP